jgi:hypothetical protein
LQAAAVEAQAMWRLVAFIALLQASVVFWQATAS